MMKKILASALALAAVAAGQARAEGGAAVYFGTFDPFHNGHLRVVEAALPEIGVDKVWLAPDPTPTKPGAGASFEARLAMCRAIAARHSKTLAVIARSEIEAAFAAGGPEGWQAALIRTVSRRLRAGQKVYQLTGIEGFNRLLQAAQLPKEGEDRVVVIVDQPGYKLDVDKLANQHVGRDQLLFLHPPALDIRGLDVHAKVKRGEDYSSLVPPVIRRYITDMGLYK